MQLKQLTIYLVTTLIIVTTEEPDEHRGREGAALLRNISRQEPRRDTQEDETNHQQHVGR